MLGYLVAPAVAAIILCLIWYRARRREAGSAARTGPDRGITGEAVTAFGDVTRQLLGQERDFQAGPDDRAHDPTNDRPFA